MDFYQEPTALTLCCDACDFSKPMNSVVPDRSYIGELCPNCGANLLTQADYDGMVKYIAHLAEQKSKALAASNESEFAMAPIGKTSVQIHDGSLTEKIEITVSEPPK